MLVDAGLAAAVRDVAVARGMTLTALVEGALEVCVDDYRGVVSGGGGGFVAEGGVVGQVGAGGGGTGVVAASGGGVNWDAVLLTGKRERVPVATHAPDPIEEIA